MATSGNRTTRTTNLVVDKSHGRQLRIMEDTLRAILHPCVEKLSKDKNWYSPLLALVGVSTALLKFDYVSIVKLNEQNEYLGINGGVLICCIIYVFLFVAALILLIRSLYYMYMYRHENLSVNGIVEDIMTLPLEEEQNDDTTKAQVQNASDASQQYKE